MPQSPLAGFDSRKAAQIAAFFVGKQPGIEKLKLIKLMYLAERGALAAFGQPMTYDEFYSLKDGPICSNALSGINGELDGAIWSQYVRMDANRRNIDLTCPLGRDDLDEISDADISILEDVWGRFGHFSTSQIRNWTHENCPEYTEVARGRVPISYADLLKAIGEEHISDVEDEIARTRRAASYLRA